MRYGSKYRIIESPISKIFSLFAKFSMMISPKMAFKPYTKTLILKIAKYWYWTSSFCNKYQTYKYQIPYRTSSSQYDPFIVWNLINLSVSMLLFFTSRPPAWTNSVGEKGDIFHIVHDDNSQDLSNRLLPVGMFLHTMISSSIKIFSGCTSTVLIFWCSRFFGVVSPPYYLMTCFTSQSLIIICVILSTFGMELY
mgnify:CR=1 FL=1